MLRNFRREKLKRYKQSGCSRLFVPFELFLSRRSCLRICALRFCGLTMAAWRSSGQVARGEGESDIFLIRRYEYTRARGIWYEGGRFACHSRTSVTCEWGKLAVPTSPPEARSRALREPAHTRNPTNASKPHGESATQIQLNPAGDSQ